MRYAITLMLLSAVAGCGGSPGPETAYVSGTVTMNGAPVTAGLVMFYPSVSKGENSGKPAQGDLDSSGEFTLRTYGSSDGAVVGEHIITVLAPSGSGERKAMGKTTPERVTVKAGESNVFEIQVLPPDPSAKPPGGDDEDDDDDD